MKKCVFSIVSVCNLVFVAIGLSDEFRSEHRARLEANQGAFDICDLSYSVKKEFANPNLPRVDQEETSLYLESGKMTCRKAVSLPLPDGNRQSTIQELAFDGQHFFHGESGENRFSSLAKMLGDNPKDEEATRQFTKFSYLDASGWSTPTTVAEWRDSQRLVSSTVLSTLSTGTMLECQSTGERVWCKLEIPDPVISGAKSLDLEKVRFRFQGEKLDEASIQEIIDTYERLRSMDGRRIVELSLDPTRGCALVERAEFTSDGKKIRESSCADFEKVQGHELWLPRRCVVKVYQKSPDFMSGFTDVPNEISNITLTNLQWGRRDGATFQLTATSGAIVTDRSVPGEPKVYIASPDKDQLRASAARTRNRSLYTILAIVVVCSLLAYFVRRSQQSV